jgi:DNA/RNA-binding domain of Phe-tRNA-synthetase-like protein
MEASAHPQPGWEPAAKQGWVAPRLATEFPGLGVVWVEVDGKPGRSPQPVRRRLGALSDRFYGAEAIRMRERPVPWAYRVFFRQIGIDPDRTRTPIEQLGFDRLHDGAFVPHGLPTDALTIATIETGVALRVFDADALRGRPCIRESAPGESLSERPGELDPGTLLLADEAGPLGLLFGADAVGREVTKASRRFALVAVQVGAVPQAAVGEALWIAASTLEGA